MRYLSPAALALGLLGTGLPAHAASPAGQPIDLHIEARAELAPDRIDVEIGLMCSGSDAAAAQADCQTRRTDVLARLGELGVDPATVAFVRDPNSEEASTAAAAAMEAAEDAETAASAPQKRAGRAEEPPAQVFRAEKANVRFTSQTKVIELLRWNREQADDTSVRVTGVATGDPAKARHAAREQALATARNDAADYAAILGYRSVRLVRVSNARPSVSMPDVAEFIRMMDGGGERAMRQGLFPPAVETVAVDFVLTP